jgi:PAS domain S-box-containing protein
MNSPEQLEFELRERLKEIRCLNDTSALLSETGRDPDSVFPALLLSIRSAFQFPEWAQAELLLGGRRYRTPGYLDTENRLCEKVSLNGQTLGSLTVCYANAPGAAFLPEETNLLKNLAQMIAYYQSQRESMWILHETVDQLVSHGAKLEALLDALPDMLFVIDDKVSIVDYRAGKEEDLAMPPEAFLDRKLAEIFPRDLSHLFLGLVERTLAGEKQVSAEYAMQLNDQPRYFETRMSRYGDHLVIALVSNITERVISRERLLQSEEKYRSLVNSSDATIIMIDRNGQIIFANAVAAEFFKISEEELAAKTVAEIFPLEQARAIIDTARSVIESNAGVTYEQTLTAGGEPRWFRASVQPVHGPDGQAFAVMINATDITAIKTANDKIQRSEKNYRSLFLTRHTAT